MTLDNIEVTPVPGKRLPKNFVEAVSCVSRPYIRITLAEYEEIMVLTDKVKPKTDVIRWKRDLYTFGNADSGWALMPLNDKGKRFIGEAC